MHHGVDAVLGDDPGDGRAAQVDPGEGDAGRQLLAGRADIHTDHAVDVAVPGDLRGEAGTEMPCHAGHEHDLAHAAEPSSVLPGCTVPRRCFGAEKAPPAAGLPKHACPPGQGPGGQGEHLVRARGGLGCGDRPPA
ncbi:hypothetical protein GCM10025734_39520 [Kitasatospora paranensis]